MTRRSDQQLKLSRESNGMSVQFAEASSSKPSIAELASFANKAMEIGGSDDIIELGDDLGMGLLANQGKVAPSPKSSSGSSRQVNTSFQLNSDAPRINLKPVDDMEVVNLDSTNGIGDISIQKNSDPAPFVIRPDGSSGFSEQPPKPAGLTPEEEAKEKQKYLTKLRRLEANDIKGVRMTMQNSLEDIKAEHDKLVDSRNLEASIRFQRNALMTFVTGVEMVNDKVGHRLPIKPKLKGWSESVHTNVEDFDEIFEELYDMYKDQAKMHPLLRLAGTLGVSATMYHLTNTMAERSGVPGMADLLNENPDLQRQFAQAAAAKMGGLGQFMSAAGGFGSSSASAPSTSGGPAPMGSSFPYQAAPPSPPKTASARVPFNTAASAPSSDGPPVRREMRGPTQSGVDDILRAFEAERAQKSNVNPIGSDQAGVFTPSGPPPASPRRVQILREGVGSSSDPLAEFLDDDGSVGSGSTMNTEAARRRGRKRAVATPVGSTIILNV
jgi:hypothetical protein